MKHLLSFDEQNYIEQKSAYESISLNIQKCISSFNDLQIGKINTDDLLKLLTDPVGLVYDKITNGEAISIAGLKINKQKAMDIIEKPIGYDLFLSNVKFAVESLRNNENNNIQAINLNNIGLIYKIDESGNVVLTTKMDEMIKERNKKYATSDVAKKLFEITQKFINEVEKHGLTNVFLSNPNGPGRVLNGVIEISRDNRLTVCIEGIMKYN
ncbi:MAG: hypothetical protein JNM71_18145 [Flavobacterium lindanitolerans]|uniref:hypothetical protein n=1 Tax=Flavobacterium lindanitolerans TaxID=428988 RepID=UPI001A4D71A3|nr:hypothetical protein [Flavobacterium lindanitolerans]MBL7869937.1 hypothetical protein [Flavobacterium lindanitolerans]